MEGVSLVQLVAYSELLGLCAALCLQEIYTTILYIKRKIISTNKSIIILYLLYFFLFISEIVSVASPYLDIDNKQALNQAANCVCYFCTLLAPLGWMLYSEHELYGSLPHNAFVRWIMCLPPIAFTIFSFTSVQNGLVFYVDENGFCSAGPYRNMVLLISLLYYVFSFIVAIIGLFGSESDIEKKKSRMLLNFSIPVIIAMLCQIFLLEGAACLGYIFALSSTFSNMVIAYNLKLKMIEEKNQFSEIIQNDKEKFEKIEYERLNESIIQARNTQVMKSLSDDFVFVCYVNLVTKEITRYHETPEISVIFEDMPSNLSPLDKLDLFFRKVILPSDFNKLTSYILNEESVNHLLTEGKTTEEFQANFDGKYKYYRLKMAVDKDNENGVIYGIYSINDFVLQKNKYEKTKRDLDIQVLRARNNAVFETLSNDYECVSYVSLLTDPTNEVINIYRDSDFIRANVPGWANERIFSNRLKAISNMIVSENDRKEFLQKTDRSFVLLQFVSENAYYVDVALTIADSRHYYQIKMTAERNDYGGITGLVLALRNMDESVKSQNELIRLEQENFEQQAFTNLFIDAYTAAYYVNLNDYSYVQYKLKDYLKDKFTAFSDFSRTVANYIENNVYDEDKEMMYLATNPETIKEKLASGEQYTAVYRDKIGPELGYRNMIITRGHDADHIAVGFIDVSEQFRKEREIQDNLKSYISTIEKQQKELEEANKSKTNFLFNMSHDIRTPMNAIIGYTDLAKEHITDTDRAVRFLDKIALSGEHLLKLINEILDMSRIEGGKIHSEISTVNVVQSAVKIVDICKEDALSRDINFQVDFSSVNEGNICMDELHVNQVLLNVLSNAIKYTKSGGSVSFSITESPASVAGYRRFEYVIQDTGIGMSEEFMEHIYDSFSRERTSTVSGIQGTGLGMAIVKKLVDYMDGSISIESKVDVGTKVMITFQFAIPSAPDSDMDDENVPHGLLTGNRILFVDDNEINREIVRAILEEEGMIMHEAVDGKDAISTIAERGIGYYDCILMDIQMPVMDGYETTQYLRKTYPNSNIPIIALSANAFEEDRRKSLASGMNGHVSKPVSALTLYKTLIKYIQNQE